LPLVVAEPGSLAARTLLLEGAMHAATALDASGLCLGHAMAQGLGGRFGLPHGTMNALCLPPALRFNAVVVLDEIARLGDAIGRDDPVAGVEELASLGAFGRLRDHGVPRDGLAAVAADIATRGGARANPRPAPPDQIAELLLSIW
jgi:alcohol dehydrogenase class IV